MKSKMFAQKRLNPPALLVNEVTCKDMLVPADMEKFNS